MSKIIFEWDPQKADLNLRKHKVSFELATLVFSDNYVLSKQDRFENGEYRWQTIGMLNHQVVLLVAHTVSIEQQTEIIRIISARKATSQERKLYEQNYTLYA